MAELERDAVLPPLREELQIRRGVNETDGSPTWLIHDPVAHRYFQVHRKAIAILHQWQIGVAGDLVDRLVEQGIELDDVDELIRFLYTNSLTRDPPEGDVRHYVKRKNNAKRSWIMRVLHNYLFFRIPLIRPHRWLKRTEPLSRVFFTRGWWFLLGAMLMLSAYLLLRQWDQFVHTFTYFFNAKGLVFYAMALVGVKCLHELGHAYAATRYGCRVATMGVAFLVMFPVLFTDTTDSWKLTSRRQRLIIDGAGVGVEITIAIIATLLWSFLPDGPARSAAFFVATTSWVMSIFINLNPLMRFDGYHFLSDLLGVQNLQSRCFALGKWRLRKFLFGLAEPAPELVNTRLRRTLIALAWSTWVYRFFLFLGIALLVHHFFFKPLGSVLAVIEVMFFIVVPILAELQQWWSRRGSIVRHFRAWLNIAITAALIAFFVVPWNTVISIPAVLEASRQMPLFASEPGQIRHVYVKQGDQVSQGQSLFDIVSPAIEQSLAQTRRRLDLTQKKLDRIAADPQSLEQKIVLQQEREQLLQTLQSHQDAANKLSVKAPISGKVVDINPGLHRGRWINGQLKLATLVSEQQAAIRGFLPADAVQRIKTGSKTAFIPDLPEAEKLEGRVVLVNDMDSQVLTVPMLASIFGGDIAVSYTDSELVPLKAQYTVQVQPTKAALQVTRAQPGVLKVAGAAESLAKRVWRRTMHVLVREVLI